MFCMNLDLIDRLKKKMAMMRKTTTLKLMAAALASIFICSAQSCKDSGRENINAYYPNAIVTIKPVDGGNPSFYMQLDDSTTLIAENMSQSPFGAKEVRALAAIEMTGHDAGQYDSTVYVYAIDSILTKNTVPFTDSVSADTEYGTDPADMIMAVVEDGYLTLRVRVVSGTHGTVHRLSLLTGINPDDPYEVEFRHRAEGPSAGDVFQPSYVLGDAFVAFRLDSLPDTKGSTVGMKLKWDSFNGEQEVVLDYRTRSSSSGEETQLK